MEISIIYNCLDKTFTVKYIAQNLDNMVSKKVFFDHEKAVDYFNDMIKDYKSIVNN